jgi:predicted GIY-YIG superfamily endonuclease
MAQRLEARIKKFPKARKEALVAGRISITTAGR